MISGIPLWLAAEKVAQSSFVLFGLSHFVTLGLVAFLSLAVLVWMRWRRSLGRTGRDVCLVLLVVLLVNESSGTAAEIAGGYFTLRDSLPLHLCDFALVTVCAALCWPAFGLSDRPWVAARPGMERLRQHLFELSYYWGLAGTVQALFTPALNEPPLSRAYIQFYVGHGGIVLGVLVMTIGLGWRPGRGSPMRAWLITTAAAVPVAGINWALSANYMYLCGPPAGATLYDYLGPWPWSVLSLSALGAVLFALLYLPYGLRKRAA